MTTLAQVKTPRIVDRALECIMAADGEWIKSAQIAEAVYSHDPNGGPMSADKCVRVSIQVEGQKRPLPIESNTQLGYRYKRAREVMEAV